LGHWPSDDVSARALLPCHQQHRHQSENSDPVGATAEAARDCALHDRVPIMLSKRPRRCSGCPCETSLTLGRKNTPASVNGTGQMEWASSAARIERQVELSILVVFADNFSRTVRLQRLQIESE